MSPPLLFLLIPFFLFSATLAAFHSSAYPPHRSLILLRHQPLILPYHHGPLLKGNLTVNLLWYGRFPSSHRAVISNFFRSLSPTSPPSVSPSVASWWATTSSYRGGAATISLGRQTLDNNYSLNRSLTAASLRRLARRGGGTSNAVTVVLTAEDVAVDGFCMSRCGFHGAAREGGRGGIKFPFVWVGNAAAQCPGECAWPYALPEYGPPGAAALVAPNGDVGVDGMVINLAALMAGVVTNPYGSGYFQGAVTAPLEAVTACTGIFGSGAYPGYPGKLLVDGKSGASYNARGVEGTEFLLPAMWDPNKFSCATLL